MEKAKKKKQAKAESSRDQSGKQSQTSSHPSAKITPTKMGFHGKDNETELNAEE